MLEQIKGNANFKVRNKEAGEVASLTKGVTDWALCECEEAGGWIASLQELLVVTEHRSHHHF